MLSASLNKTFPSFVCFGRVAPSINYIDTVLRRVTLPQFGFHPDLRTFQQSNARVHIARLTVQFLANAHVRVFGMARALAPV